MPNFFAFIQGWKGTVYIVVLGVPNTIGGARGGFFALFNIKKYYILHENKINSFI